MSNETVTNSTNCNYCGGKGYFEIHNAYDITNVEIEICRECTTTNFGSSFLPAEKIIN